MQTGYVESERAQLFYGCSRCTLHIIFHYAFALGVHRAALFVYFHTRRTRVRIVRARPRELPFGSLTHSDRSLTSLYYRRMQIARRRHHRDFSLSVRRFIVWLMYASASAPLRSQPVSTGELSAQADCPVTARVDFWAHTQLSL